MIVKVLFFAGAKERAGVDRVDLDVAKSATVGEIVERAVKQVGSMDLGLARVMLARNGEYVDRDASVADGDEIAVIPPVSGGQTDETGLRKTSHVSISGSRIRPESVVEMVGSDADGAIVVFHGVTRDHNEGRRVLHLEYEAYSPMAEREMLSIIDEMRRRWDIGKVAVCHRTGRVDIGEISMVLAVSAAHRRPAFESALYFIDRLKEVVPIWKKEYFEGGEIWIGDTPG